ncbi:MAG: hypothetical protein WDM91_04195 [Rhizomicrobium sp.]
MRKRTIFTISGLLGGGLVLSAAESDWLLAAVIGVALGLSTALFVHVYPHDIAPPADRRHEASQRRKASLKA